MPAQGSLRAGPGVAPCRPRGHAVPDQAWIPHPPGLWCAAAASALPPPVGRAAPPLDTARAVPRTRYMTRISSVAEAGVTVAEALLFSVWRVLERLPEGPVPHAEQSQRGGVLFPGGATFVRLTLRALEQHPEAYPDLAARAPAIRAAQERADRWEEVADLGLRLSHFARGHHIREQGIAIESSKQVLSQVKKSSELAELLPTLDHPHRREWIYAAYRVMQRHLRAVSDRRDARRRAERPEDRPTPKQKTLRREALLRTLHEHLLKT